MMTKPIVSKDFNLEDIRKIREYNSLRHVQMTPREIVEDTRKGAAMILERLRQSEKASVRQDFGKGGQRWLPFCEMRRGEYYKTKGK